MSQLSVESDGNDVLCWYALLFQMLEEYIMNFVKTELKTLKKRLAPEDPECSEKLREDDEVLVEGEEEEEKQRSSRDAFLNITLNFLRRMKKEQLADCLQTSKML